MEEEEDPQFGVRKGHVGTPDYMAPEILLGQVHTEAVDWWSLGVVAYELMIGTPPFNAASAEDVFANILQRRLEWPVASLEEEEEEEGISEEAKLLIESLLVLDPKKRLGTRGGVSEVKRHSFFNGVPWDRLTMDDTYVPFVPSIDSAVDTSYFSPDRRKQMTTVEEPPTPVSRQVGSHGHRFKNFGFNIDNSEMMREGDDETDSATSTPRK